MPFVSANTPVIVGASQFTERIDDPDYATLSPVAITARAAELALMDAGMDGCKEHIDTDDDAYFRRFGSGLGIPFWTLE